MAKKSSTKSQRIILGFLVFLILLTLGVYFSPYPFSYFTPNKLYHRVLNLKQSRSLPEKTPSPKYEKPPCPSPYPLPEGKELYRLSHGDEVKGPKLQTVTLDPIKLEKDQTQTLTATIKYDTDVTKAQLTIKTDNKTLDKTLKLVSGNKQDGTWKTKWTLDDTYLCTYIFDFTLESEKNSWNGAITVR